MDAGHWYGDPSRYHADPVLGENRPYADTTNGVHYFDNLAVAA